MVATMIFGLFLIASMCSIHSAAAHGYMTSPRSREFVAHATQEGKWSPTGNASQDQSTPAAESCPHCANRQAVINGAVGTCGLTSSGYNYDAPKNVLGATLPPKIQATYMQGQQVDLQVILTAHHKGHFTYKACALKAGQTTATQQCFDSNPLIFVRDNLYGAPKDPNYPDRAYIPLETYPGLQKGGNPYGIKYNHRFSLPGNLVGDRVLIQWQYWTANSCIYPGYRSVKWPANYFDQQGLSDCGSYPRDGNGIPEQFWNCAEVKITGSTGTVGNWQTCIKGVSTCADNWQCCVAPADCATGKTTCRPGGSECSSCSSGGTVGNWQTCIKGVSTCADNWQCCVAPADCTTKKTTCRPGGSECSNC